jgi:hypothetical protein
LILNPLDFFSSGATGGAPCDALTTGAGDPDADLDDASPESVAAALPCPSLIFGPPPAEAGFGFDFDFDLFLAMESGASESEDGKENCDGEKRAAAELLAAAAVPPLAWKRRRAAGESLRTTMRRGAARGLDFGVDAAVEAGAETGGCDGAGRGCVGCDSGAG